MTSPSTPCGNDYSGTTTFTTTMSSMHQFISSHVDRTVLMPLLVGLLQRLLQRLLKKIYQNGGSLMSSSLKRGISSSKKPAGTGSQKKELLPAPLPYFSLRRCYIVGETTVGAIFPTKHGALSIALPKNKEGAIFLEEPEQRLKLARKSPTKWGLTIGRG